MQCGWMEEWMKSLDRSIEIGESQMSLGSEPSLSQAESCLFLLSKRKDGERSTKRWMLKTTPRRVVGTTEADQNTSLKAWKCSFHSPFQSQWWPHPLRMPSSVPWTVLQAIGNSSYFYISPTHPHTTSFWKIPVLIYLSGSHLYDVASFSLAYNWFPGAGVAYCFVCIPRERVCLLSQGDLPYISEDLGHERKTEWSKITDFLDTLHFQPQILIVFPLMWSIPY